METTQVNPGTYGAKRQSFNKANPRDILIKIVNENPNISEDEALQELWNQIHNKPTILRTVVEYWFANNWRSIDITHSRNIVPRTASAPRANVQRTDTDIKLPTNKQITSFVQQKIKLKATAILMQMILPNGKSLGETTGAELKEIAPAIGNWLCALTIKVPEDKKVSEVLTEEELKSLYENQ